MLPFIWVSVVVLVLLTHKPAEYLTSKILYKDDSFNAHMTINLLCHVFLMSGFLTVIGTWSGSRHICFVSSGRPVLAMKNNTEAVLITAYNTAQVSYFDPSVGNTQTISISRAIKLFEDAGNIFMSIRSKE